jgi:hypothetical protein
MSLTRRLARWSCLVAAVVVAVGVAGCSSGRGCRPCNTDWAVYGEFFRGAGEMPCAPCGTDWATYGDFIRGELPCQDCPRQPACRPCGPDCNPCIPCPRSQPYVADIPPAR